MWLKQKGFLQAESLKYFGKKNVVIPVLLNKDYGLVRQVIFSCRTHLWKPDQTSSQNRYISLHISIGNIRLQKQYYSSIACLGLLGSGRISLLVQKYWMQVQETTRMKYMKHQKYSSHEKGLTRKPGIRSKGEATSPESSPGLLHSFWTGSFLSFLAQLISPPTTRRVMAKYQRVQRWHSGAGSG